MNRLQPYVAESPGGISDWRLWKDGIMNTTYPFAPFRHAGVFAMALLFLATAAAPTAKVTTDDIYPGWIQITCKLAYYAEFRYNGNTNGLTYDVQLKVPDQHRTNTTGIDVEGVVMQVVTPKEHAGQTICIWLDPPAVLSGGVRFKPGLVYAGKWRKEFIGTLTFKGEVPFVPVAEPDGAANRSQPVRFETNQTSGAAGSAR